MSRCWWCDGEIDRHRNRPGQSQAIVVTHLYMNSTIIRTTCSAKCARQAVTFYASDYEARDQRHAERGDARWRPSSVFKERFGFTLLRKMCSASGHIGSSNIGPTGSPCRRPVICSVCEGHASCS